VSGIGLAAAHLVLSVGIPKCLYEVSGPKWASVHRPIDTRNHEYVRMVQAVVHDMILL